MHVRSFNDADFFFFTPPQINNLLKPCPYTNPPQRFAHQALKPRPPRSSSQSFLVFLRWTRRCSRPHWEIPDIWACSRAFLSRHASKAWRIRGSDRGSNVNAHTYAGLKLWRVQILNGKQKLSRCPGCEDKRCREGVKNKKKTQRTVLLLCVQITEQAYIISNAQHGDKISAWLPPIPLSWSAVWTARAEREKKKKTYIIIISEPACLPACLPFSKSQRQWNCCCHIAAVDLLTRYFAGFIFF